MARHRMSRLEWLALVVRRMERARQRRLIEVLRLSGWAAERPDVAAITVPHGFLQVCGLAPPNPESCAKVYCPGCPMYCTVWNSCSLDPVGRPINLLRALGGSKLTTACRGVADRRTKMPSFHVCIPDEVDGLGVVWLAAANGARGMIRGRLSQHRCTAPTAVQHPAPH